MVARLSTKIERSVTRVAKRIETSTSVTPAAPTASGISAATTEPKTSSSATRAMGKTITSARRRSRWLTVSMSR